MAKKITSLSEITTVNDDDLLVAVDISDHTMATTGTNKKVTKQNILKEVNNDISDLDNAVVKKTDTDVSGNSWVVDEDDMASDSDKKVPTQQSVKAYVDNNASGDWNSQTDVIPTRTSADDPTYVIQFAGVDLTSKVSVGQKMAFKQNITAQAYYKFQGNSNDEQNSHNGTDTDITYSTSNGKFNQGAGFNGSSSKIAIADHSDFKPTGAFSVGGWFKTSTTATTMRLFASYNTHGIIVYIRPSDGVALYTKNGTGEIYTYKSGVNTEHCDGSWHQVTCVYNGSEYFLYVDGELLKRKNDNNSAPSFDSTNYVTIGAKHDGTLNFNGSMDDWFFINGQVLSHEKIKEIYNAGNEIGSFPLEAQKYSFVTALSVSGGNTSLTIYGGTDYDVDDTSTYAISDVKFSSMKAPYSFPLDPDKWSEEYFSSARLSYNNLDDNYHQLGSAQLDIPIGKWNISVAGMGQLRNNSTDWYGIVTTLSESASGLVGFDGKIENTFINQENVYLRTPFFKTAPKEYNSKKTIYFILRGQEPPTPVDIDFVNIDNLHIKATIAYL